MPAKVLKERESAQKVDFKSIIQKYTQNKDLLSDIEVTEKSSPTDEEDFRPISHLS